MPPENLTATLHGVEAALRQFETGSNWIERRDAIDVLGLCAREIGHALRAGAADSDPDVAHAASQLLLALKKDLTGSAEAAAIEIAAQRRAVQGALDSEPDEARESASGQGAGAAPSPAEIRRWLTELAEVHKAKVVGEGELLTVKFPLQGGRSQKVYVDLDEQDSAGEPLVLLYTVCGEPRPEVYPRALLANARLSHAAFALLRRAENERLIMVCRRRLAGLRQPAFASNMLYIAKKGDEAQAQLEAKGKD